MAQAQAQRSSILSMLLDAALVQQGGRDLVNLTDRTGTPLLLAIFHGHVATVKLLLTKGAAVNPMLKDGYAATPTPLWKAAAEGQEEIAQLLLDEGADVNPSTRFGKSPLFYPVEKGHVSIVEMLIDNGADINAKTKQGGNPDILFGVSPLHRAVQRFKRGRVAILQLLLDNGADMHARTSSGETPEDLANGLRSPEQEEVVAVLRAATMRRREAFAMSQNERLGARTGDLLGLETGVVGMILDQT
jgi:ankyrin repeat protein